jgi:hypothetical protein
MFDNNELEKNLESIKKIFDSQDKKIEKLKEENRYLKDEYDKDEEIQKLKKRLDKAIQDNVRGFPISEEEEKTISKWTKEHIRKKHWDKKYDCPKSFGAIGGNFKYEFIPTSIGIIGTIKCSCGECLDFKKI